MDAAPQQGQGQRSDQEKAFNSCFHGGNALLPIVCFYYIRIPRRFSGRGLKCRIFALKRGRDGFSTAFPLLDAWRETHAASLRCKAFQSAVELLEAAQQERFTLYLLDVMMPGMDGLEAAREIRRFDDAAEIVFLSTSPGFAYESYGVRALNYLLKPVEQSKLFPVLDDLSLQEQKNSEALTLKSGATFVRVPYTQISYAEVIGKHVYFHLTDGNVREVTASLKDVESMLLPRPEFMRVHRFYIVNMFQVEQLSSAGLRTFQGQSLPVSRLSYPQLQKDYMALLFDQRGAEGS